MELKVPEVWPGEKGFSLLAADKLLCRIGTVTGCWYRFKPGVARYVDKRDMPQLPRKGLTRANLDAPGERAQETPELGGDSEGSGENS